MPNIVVYTSIFGAYDRLRPVNLDTAAQFVCFTDQPQKADGWDVRMVKAEPASDPRRANRRIKIMPADLFPDADFTLYVDGNLHPLVPPERMIEECLHDADVAAFAHCLRDCAYQEANAVLAKRKDAPETVYAQMNEYRRQGFPEHNGLGECTMVLRAQSAEMERFGKLWWEQIERHSVRDQLSFNYCLWKLQLPWHVIPGYVRKHPWFHWQEHVRLVRWNDGN